MIDTTALVISSSQPRTDRHLLAGVVTVDGSPAGKRVVLVSRGSLQLLAATISNPTTGAWTLAGLPEYAEGALLVLAMDDAGTYNAEVADYVSQVTGVGV